MCHCIRWPCGMGCTSWYHIVDATPRLALEARQRHEESLLRLQFMVENLPAGAVYVSVGQSDPARQSAFEKMTGYSADELTHHDQAFQILFGERPPKSSNYTTRTSLRDFDVARTGTGAQGRPQGLG